VRTQEGLGVRAALPALVGGCLLAGGAYLVDGQPLKATLLGGAAAMILFLLVGFPEMANRRIRGRVHPPSWRARRAVRSLFAFALVVLVLGVALDSLALIILAVAFCLFWLILIRIARRKAD
jgi:uncharacterized iron-regulated membrane protein